MIYINDRPTAHKDSVNIRQVIQGLVNQEMKKVEENLPEPWQEEDYEFYKVKTFIVEKRDIFGRVTEKYVSDEYFDVFKST